MSSAAARNWRTATSPSVISGPSSGGSRADNSLAMTVALSVAAPAETMPFLKNDRRLVLFFALVIRFIVLLLLLSVVIVVSRAARQEVIEDEIRDVATEPLPTRQVVAEVHARKNAALRRFVGSRRDARERACRAR